MLSIDAAALFAFSALLLWPASTLLARAEWVSSAPRAAVALWQSIGVSALVAGIGGGLCVGVERFHSGFGGGVAQLFDTLTQGDPLRARALRRARTDTRHRPRRCLDLPPGVHHGAHGTGPSTAPTPRRSTLKRRARGSWRPPARSSEGCGLLPPRVPTEDRDKRGTVDLLSKSELAAVLSHEQGHATERHGLVMMPIVGIRNLFHWVPYARLAPESVAGLLEMAADDYSVRHHDPALSRVGTCHDGDCGRAPFMCPCHRLDKRHRAGQPAAQRLENIPSGCRCCCVRLHRAAPRSGDRPHRLLKVPLDLERPTRSATRDDPAEWNNRHLDSQRAGTTKSQGHSTLRPNFDAPARCSSMRWSCPGTSEACPWAGISS